MKWYSHRAYRQHMYDMKVTKDKNELRAAYQDWAKVISNRFDRSYSRIGVLNLQDLLQEGYVGFYKAWERLDWKLINEVVEPERIGMITNYLKLAVKRHIIRAITNDRDTIRIPEQFYMENKNYGGKNNKAYQTDIFMTRTFSSFFTPEYLDIADDAGDYMNDKLNNFLNDIMNEFNTSFEKTIITKYFGIDEPYDKPKSIKRIAEYCKCSQIWIKKSKAKGLQKLQQKEVKELINNYIEKLYT